MSEINKLRSLCNNSGISCRDTTGRLLPKKVLVNKLQQKGGGRWGTKLCSITGCSVIKDKINVTMVLPNSIRLFKINTRRTVVDCNDALNLIASELTAELDKTKAIDGYYMPSDLQYECNHDRGQHHIIYVYPNASNQVIYEEKQLYV